MNVTEDDAAELWCPMVRLSNEDDHGSYNRWNVAVLADGVVPAVACIGSRCMMWTWNEPQRAGEERRGMCGLSLRYSVDE